MFENDCNGRQRLPGERDSEQQHSQNQPFKCSLCGKRFDHMVSKSMPFCSVRCQQIDLGNWLNEDYGFPVESGELPEESAED